MKIENNTLQPATRGIELEVRNNTMHSIKTGDIEEYIKDNSSYRVSISQEALALLLEYSELTQVLPKLTAPKTVYNYKGELV